MQGVIGLIEDAATRDGFSRVRTVWLEIGQLSSVEPEAMRFCFDLATKGTIADGARLEVVATPGSAWCMQCSKSVALSSAHAGCPDCGSFQLQLTAGTEMRVKELEVE